MEKEEQREQLLLQAMDTYGGAIHGYFRKLTQNDHDAEDLSQQLWLLVFQRFQDEEFLNPSRLYRKAYQIFVDDWRKRKTRSFVFGTDEVPEIAVLPSHDESNDLEYERSLYQEFWDGFPSIELTDPQKLAFWYHERYGYTIRETAEKIGSSRSTVGDWIKLCKERCLKYLNEEEKENEDA